MNIDRDKKFRDIFPSPKDLKRQLLNIRRTVVDRGIVEKGAHFTGVKGKNSGHPEKELNWSFLIYERAMW
jgi:hypothetical protein